MLAMMNIKKLFCLAITVLFFSQIRLFAQIGEHRSRLSIGGGGGMTFSSIDFDPTIKQSQLACPMIGVALRYTCEKYFSTLCALQVEMNFVRLGWKEDIVDSQSQPLEDTYQRELSYVQIPLLARMAWGREKRGLSFFIMAGPQFSYNLGNTSKQSNVWTLNQDGNPDRPNNVYQQYSMEPQRKVDYGLTGGLGLELSTAIGHFTLEGRYYFGLNDIYNNSKKDVFARSAHRSIMGKLTYFFDLFDK